MFCQRVLPESNTSVHRGGAEAHALWLSEKVRTSAWTDWTSDHWYCAQVYSIADARDLLRVPQGSNSRHRNFECLLFLWFGRCFWNPERPMQGHVHCVFLCDSRCVSSHSFWCVSHARRPLWQQSQPQNTDDVEDEYMQFFHTCDEDQDGRINFEDFENYCSIHGEAWSHSIPSNRSTNTLPPLQSKTTLIG